jgi:two-component sensor histidine kinase
VHDVGTVQDITERKEREGKEQVLMREINHRAKNMLSVVDAIAHQTAAKNPKDFIERFSERIQSLSANQDLLVQNEWKGVEIGDLVHAQLARFADLIGRRIVAQGPKLRLNPASCTSNRARTPRAYDKRWEIRGAVDGERPCRYPL